MTTNKFNSTEWLQTDSLQWMKQESENKFDILDITINNDQIKFNEVYVNLEDYTEEEIKESINGYYDSIEEVKETYKESWKQIVSECIAEQNYDSTFKTSDYEEAYIFMKDSYGIELNFKEL